jgi:hypothetical protein
MNISDSLMAQATADCLVIMPRPISPQRSRLSKELAAMQFGSLEKGPLSEELVLPASEERASPVKVGLKVRWLDPTSPEAIASPEKPPSPARSISVSNIVYSKTINLFAKSLSPEKLVPPEKKPKRRVGTFLLLKILQLFPMI